jgi:hypothetical protein
MTRNDNNNDKGTTMSATAKAAVKAAIKHAEQFAVFLQPQLRRDIALGQVTLWARMQDGEATAKLAATVVAMGDEIVAYYSTTFA